MAQTLPDLIIPSDQYVSINSLSGVAVGEKMLLQLKGSSWLKIAESAAQPAADSDDGLIISNLDYAYALAEIRKGSLEVWAICIGNPAIESVQHTILNVQPVLI